MGLETIWQNAFGNRQLNKFNVRTRTIICIALLMNSFINIRLCLVGTNVDIYVFIILKKFNMQNNHYPHATRTRTRSN